ncbi:MAG: RidA family protein [Pseudonocardiaceae bacterium]|nr:RidA family protein [Pseudonocardiaceae bacterium]
MDRINPDSLARPSGFSHAVSVTGARLVFLAGQTALDPEGAIVGGGIVAQFERAMSNLLTALHAAGGRPEHLAQLTIYLVDIDDYRAHAKEIGGVWRELIGAHYPAAAGIGVHRLWDPEALVEVQAVAAVPET